MLEINIEKKARRITLYHQKQINRLSNSNDPRLLIVLDSPFQSIHQYSANTIERELRIPRFTAHRLNMLQFVQYHPYHINLIGTGIE